MTKEQQRLADRFDRALQDILTCPAAKRNLVKYSWTIGSTTVKPVQVWSNDLELQWGSRRPCPKWINSVVEKYPELFQRGYFDAKDGSCPPAVEFVFTAELARALSERRCAQ